ncbi:MAG TPA: prolipoprotein diacylglyceryl transferase family protein [Flavitalea sp.]|nr:prolipoprotein diacylglyceryl transferase family protein [Flavitalea sp.]
MYPNLYYAFKDIFGVEVPGLRFVNSFGFFVAFAFLIAAYVLTKELKRKEREGLLHGKDVEIEVGKPAGIADLLLNFILGFILGYKIVGLFLLRNEITSDPQQFIFSAQGHLPAGLILGALFAGIKWWEKNKQKLAQPEKRNIRIWPHDRVGDLVIYAAVAGFLGAKIFHNLENWKDFQQHPIEALLSFSGLTFYGGLICGTIAVVYYARKHQIAVKHLADAIAPALLLAYAVGRIGCQVSGDGDWGILNSAYVTGPNSKAIMADTTTFKIALNGNAVFYRRTFDVSPEQVEHKKVPAPSWLPVWMVAYAYPHNVINEGVEMPGCTGTYCNHLPIPVFPTPFYETVVCLVLFGILWALRKRLPVAGTVFAVYLIFNGIERFLVEKIRVNSRYDLFGFHPTQAEIISTLLVVIGAGLYFYLVKKYPASKKV